MIELNDYFLINFFVNNYESISFLSKDTIDNYVNKIKIIKDKTSEKRLTEEGLKRIFNPSRKDSIEVLDFWERLLIDAIKYLKWHDLGEFDPKGPSDLRKPTDFTKKEEAYDRISEGSLGVYNLKDYFKEFIKFERLLYGAKESYRDHVYHVIRVWLIGQYILKTHIKNDFLIDIIEDKLKLTDTQLSKSNKNKNTLYEGEEDAIWCLIALNHDLGYPLGKIEEIDFSIKKMMGYFAQTRIEEFSFSFPQQNQFINETILDYMSSRIMISKNKTPKFHTHIQAKYFLKFSQSFERFKHGIISCIVLARNLIYFLETNYDFDMLSSLEGKEEARQFVIRREILRAIASHTCPEIYHLKPNTFSFLLLIADELQFFGRPTFESLALGVNKNYKVILHDYSKSEVSFEIICKSNKNYKINSMCNFFKEKAELFKKILRVAVKSSDRKFRLKFTVQDETGLAFEFVAEKDKRATVKLIDKNGFEKDITHTQLQRVSSTLLQRKDQRVKMKTLLKDCQII